MTVSPNLFRFQNNGQSTDSVQLRWPFVQTNFQFADHFDLVCSLEQGPTVGEKGSGPVAFPSPLTSLIDFYLLFSPMQSLVPGYLACKQKANRKNTFSHHNFSTGQASFFCSCLLCLSYCRVVICINFWLCSRKDMTELKFLWGVKLRKFILSPACQLLPAMRNWSNRKKCIRCWCWSLKFYKQCTYR